MRSSKGKPLAAVWKHPDLKLKVAAYSREDIATVFSKHYNCSSDLYAINLWTRIYGLWSETERVIE